MKSFVLTSLALSAFAFVAVPATLADTKIYSPLSCRGTTTVLPNINSNGAVINNSSTLPFTVLCPIPRDNTGARPTSIQVNVTDNSSAVLGDGDFQCNAISTTKTGITAVAGSTAQTAGTNSAGVTLNLAVPTVLADGLLFVKCKIPRRGVGDPASFMGAIKVVEPDPGN